MTRISLLVRVQTDSMSNTGESNSVETHNGTATTASDDYAATQSGVTANNVKKPDDTIQELKKSLKLDFSTAESTQKSLQTPDIQKLLSLASPEFERILRQSGTFVQYTCKFYFSYFKRTHS